MSNEDDFVEIEDIKIDNQTESNHNEIKDNEKDRNINEENNEANILNENILNEINNQNENIEINNENESKNEINSQKQIDKECAQNKNEYQPIINL